MATVHNYTKQKKGWGHDIVFDPSSGPAMIFGIGIKKGDFILLSNGGDDTTRYKVSGVKYKINPSDMCEAQLVYSPRTEFEKAYDHERLHDIRWDLPNGL